MTQASSKHGQDRIVRYPGRPPVFTGTDIPVSEVVKMIKAGATIETIGAAFPRLTVADLAAAAQVKEADAA